MPTIVGISGSLRQGSYNSMLLRAAVGAAPAGVTVEEASIRDIPLYDGDVEASSGVPAPVEALKARIVSSDGLLIATPEYNNSIPGVVKNAIDWLSRPPADIGRVFKGRPVAIMGATPGLGSTNLSQAAWLPIIRTLGMLPWFEGRLGVPGAAKVFDANGTIVDERIAERLTAFVHGFAAFVAAQRKS